MDLKVINRTLNYYLEFKKTNGELDVVEIDNKKYYVAQWITEQNINDREILTVMEQRVVPIDTPIKEIRQFFNEWTSYVEQFYRIAKRTILMNLNK